MRSRRLFQIHCLLYDNGSDDKRNADTINWLQVRSVFVMGKDLFRHAT